MDPLLRLSYDRSSLQQQHRLTIPLPAMSLSACSLRGTLLHGRELVSLAEASTPILKVRYTVVVTTITSSI